MDNRKAKIVELNVGGKRYATTLASLMYDPGSVLAHYFAVVCNSTDGIAAGSLNAGSPSNARSPTPVNGQQPTGAAPVIQCQEDGAYFIDRDGDLFRHILEYLRTGKILLPDGYPDFVRLREEAKFYKLNELVKQLKPLNNAVSVPSRRNVQHNMLPTLVNGNSNANSGVNSAVTWGYITVGYRGTFAFGRDGQADVKFRKLSRIIVCGRANLCREVFGETLNESRDPDRGGESRYTARLYLKHNSLELAFDTLAERGFELITSCASGTCASGDLMRGSAADSEEQKWNHYNEFVFFRSPVYRQSV